MRAIKQVKLIETLSDGIQAHQTRVNQALVTHMVSWEKQMSLLHTLGEELSNHSIKDCILSVESTSSFPSHGNPRNYFTQVTYLTVPELENQILEEEREELERLQEEKEKEAAENATPVVGDETRGQNTTSKWVTRF